MSNMIPPFHTNVMMVLANCGGVVRYLRPGRVVDILEASGAFDPGSNPGRGATCKKSNFIFYIAPFN